MLPLEAFSSANDDSIRTLTEFPQHAQLVLEGRLCRSNLVDDLGECLFDRSLIEPLSQSSEQKINFDEAVHTVSAIANAETELKLIEEECPVCRYIKAGPCAKEWKQWDACVGASVGDEDVQGCFATTVAMMSCFKNYEYYDILTAGTRAQLYDSETEPLTRVINSDTKKDV